MEGMLENRCRTLMDKREYKECERILREAMAKNPHSAIPHNLMGILMEREKNHVLAMKHFRAAYELDPAYVPARVNMDRYGTLEPTGRYAYTEEDCPVQEDPRFTLVYDEHHVGRLLRR